MTDVKDSPLREAAPAGNPNSYPTKEVITAYLRGVDPESVTASGQAYLDLAESYDKAMSELRGFAHDLANAWKGPASNAAQGQLRDLFSAAFQITSRSQQIGTAVKTHGTSYLAWYRGDMPTPKTLEEARQWMQGANERAAETWSAIPADISTSLPPVQSGRRELGSPAGGGGSAIGSGSPGGGTGSAGPGGAGAGGSAAGRTGGTHLSNRSGPTADAGASTHLSHSTPGAVIGHPPSSGGHVGGGLPATDGPGSTQLSGLSPGGANTDGLGMERPGGYGVAGGLGPGGSAGGGLPPGSAGGALPGGGATPLGTGGGYISGPGAIGSAPGPLTMGSGGGAVAGRPGAPGAGVPGAPGHGGRNKERERGAWLPDEQDIWDEGIEAVPGIIGNAPPKPITSEKQADGEQTDEAVLLRRVLARLAELESRGDEVPPPPPAPPRMEWTD
ncbi:MAG TPA: WXG100 family type VII secretion target [Spirillospora sp.]|nr:WXG100 family type VII secretion target [Spirillospora sp.]